MAPNCTSVGLDINNITKGLKNIKSNKAAGPDMEFQVNIVKLSRPATIDIVQWQGILKNRSNICSFFLCGIVQ